MPKLSIIEYKNIEKEYFTPTQVKEDINLKSYNKIRELRKKNIKLLSFKNNKIIQLEKNIKELEQYKKLNNKEQKEIKIELQEDIKQLETVAINVNNHLEVHTNQMDEYGETTKDAKLKLDELKYRIDHKMKDKLENEINKNAELRKDIKIKNTKLNDMETKECPKCIVTKCSIESNNNLYMIIVILTLIIAIIFYLKFFKKY